MSKELFQMYLDNLNTSIELIDVIIPTIRAFDGKKYDREQLRIAVNDAIFVYCNKDFCSKKALFYPSMSATHIRFDLQFYYNRTYEGDEGWEIMPDKYDTITILDKQACPRRGKIIDADEIIKDLETSKQPLRDKIVTLQKEMERIDEYRQKLSELRKGAEELNNQVPDIIKKFYGLKTYALWM